MNNFAFKITSKVAFIKCALNLAMDRIILLVVRRGDLENKFQLPRLITILDVYKLIVLQVFFLMKVFRTLQCSYSVVIWST